MSQVNNARPEPDPIVTPMVLAALNQFHRGEINKVDGDHKPEYRISRWVPNVEPTFRPGWYKVGALRLVQSSAEKVADVYQRVQTIECSYLGAWLRALYAARVQNKLHDSK